MSTQRERGAMVAAAMSVIVADLRGAQPKDRRGEAAREEQLNAAFDKLASHALTMLTQMACDAEQAARSLDALVRIMAVGVEAQLLEQSRRDNGTPHYQTYLRSVGTVMQEYQDHGRDHTGAAGYGQDYPNDRAGGGGAGARHEA